MTPLTQQLEDKKKGCGNDTKYMHGMNTLLDKKCGEYPFNDKGLPIIYCPTCQAEIAILEQAIAEMQKQRQEILDKIRLEFHTFREEFIESELNIEDFDIGNLLYNIEQQLNQPKTEE